MYRVEVKNPCRCFWRSGLAESEEFATATEARERAEELREHMMRHFCKKHDFLVSQTGLTFSVMIVPRR